MMGGMPAKEETAPRGATETGAAMSRGRMIHALFPALVFFAGYFILNFKTFQEACNRSGDYALILLETLRAARFEVLTGPYSRFGFHHPGPIYFYLYALFEPLGCFAARAQGRLYFVQFLLNAVLLLYSLRLVVKAKQPPISAALLWLLILVSFYPSRGGVLHDIWGPSTLLAPFLTLLVTGAAFAAGRTKEFPMLILSFSLLISNHLGTLPVAAPVALAGFIGWLTLGTRERGRAETVMLLVGVIVGILAAAPAVVEAFTRPRAGNLGQIAVFFASGPVGESLGLRSGLRLVASYYSAAVRIPAPLPVLAAVTLLTAIMIKSAWSGQSLFLRRLTALVLISLICAIPAAASIRGKQYQYLMLYLYALVAVHLFLLAGWLISKVRRDRVVPGYLCSGGAVILSLILLSPYEQNAPRCGVKYDQLLADIQPSRDELIILKPGENRVWGQMAGLVYRLKMQGYEVCVPERWQFMFGHSLVCRRALTETGLREKRVTITNGAVAVDSTQQLRGTSPYEGSK